MAWEDLWWEIHNEITELKLKRKFDAQLSKMESQEKHRYRDTRSRWEYARNKVVTEYYEKKSKKAGK
tara:strand:- start:31 stop:231 length:201 start_codon:yes stop_codon:yes gene_type:complete